MALWRDLFWHMIRTYEGFAGYITLINRVGASMEHQYHHWELCFPATLITFAYRPCHAESLSIGIVADEDKAKTKSKLG